MSGHPARSEAGLTLVELLVAMSVVVLMGLMMVIMMSTGLDTWRSAERQREVWTRARTVFMSLEEDLSAAITGDPPGTAVRNRMFCDIDPSGRQVLMLSRTFGTGGERGVVFSAGDGLDVTGRFPTGEKVLADDEDADERTGRTDEEIYNFIDDDGDGRLDEDLAPLGGSAQVVYLHQGRELKRAVRSPAGDEFRSMFPQAQTMCGDVLYFGLLFATAGTATESRGDALTLCWDERLPRLPDPKKPRLRLGPERIWDSTRGVLTAFAWYAGPESRDDGEDDVFPEAVRVTLVVEADDLRTVRTETRSHLDEATGLIAVASTRGFPPPGREDSYILVDDEWMHYSEMADRSFTVDRRGVRGTTGNSHPPGASVRCGVTFTRTIYLPGYRNEDAAPPSAR